MPIVCVCVRHLNLVCPFNSDPTGRKKKVYEQQENEENPLRCPVKLYEFYLSKWYVYPLAFRRKTLSLIRPFFNHLQPRECENAQRCLLSAARALLRTWFTGVVFHTGTRQGSLKQNVASRQNGERNQYRIADELELTQHIEDEDHNRPQTYRNRPFISNIKLEEPIFFLQFWQTNILCIPSMFFWKVLHSTTFSYYMFIYFLFSRTNSQEYTFSNGAQSTTIDHAFFCFCFFFCCV